MKTSIFDCLSLLPFGSGWATFFLEVASKGHRTLLWQPQFLMAPQKFHAPTAEETHMTLHQLSVIAIVAFPHQSSSWGLSCSLKQVIHWLIINLIITNQWQNQSINQSGIIIIQNHCHESLWQSWCLICSIQYWTVQPSKTPKPPKPKTRSITIQSTGRKNADHRPDDIHRYSVSSHFVEFSVLSWSWGWNDSGSANWTGL